MVKPDPLGVMNGREVMVILPRASEEYGPISHYYIVVVPEDNPYRHPDAYITKHVSGGGGGEGAGLFGRKRGLIEVWLSSCYRCLLYFSGILINGLVSARSIKSIMCVF